MKKWITSTFQITCIFSTSFLLNSCQSTDIYFDIQKQSLVSCNDRPLKRIIIECDSTNSKENDCIVDLYSKHTSASVKLDSIFKIYKYTKKQIFYPNCSYRITFIGSGDQGSTDLKIWLDDTGKAYKTNKPTCN
ncbi:hypothetical protein [Flavobacterium quisquiliarum]|uniref:Lipoprotein n=1 Tax=Flavobacterium quisquiliarum TaxID=1834436 RepID=A0ABV8W506_9FLAO|nr:hypothetical protein [Flavobacterium quisquiliarum]MBW1655566.1 hypothetical protein [Flavobacterium quisquiliarum]